MLPRARVLTLVARQGHLRLLAFAAICLQACVAAAEDSADAGDSWRVEEIVITGQRPGYTTTDSSGATRTPTALEEIPQSVQVLNATLIEEQDLRTLNDALVNVSGVVPVRTLELLTREKIIRGFDASTYFDGMPAYGLTSVADPTTLVNVERIEVLKGPSATLFSGGSGAPLSGLVNIVSKAPRKDLAVAAAVRVGSFETTSIEGDINLPLLGDTLLFRLTGDWSEANSYIDAIDSEGWTLYPTIAWRIADDTLLTLRGQFGDQEQLEYSGLPAANTLLPSPRIDPEVFTGARDAPKSEIHNTLLTATLEHRFSDALSASLSLRRYDSRFFEYGTTPFPLVPTASPTSYFFASAELPTDVEQSFLSASLLWEVEAGGTTHRILGGFDLDDTNYEAKLGFDFIGQLDYATGDDAPFVRPFLTDLQRDSLQTKAVFLQDQIGIGERLDVTIGLRWTELEIDSNYESGGLTFVDTEETERRLTSRVGATYVVSDGLSLFAGFSEGFQGLVAAFGVADPKPEESRSYDVGAHFTAPVPGLTGTVSLYHVTRENVVTGDPGNPFASIQAGEQRARGFEFDLVYEPTPAISLLASYGYTDVEVTDDNVLPEGDRPARVPEHAGRLAGRYRFQDGVLAGLELGAGVTFTGKRDLTLPNDIEADALTLVDAQASYDFGPVELSVSIVNLFDEDEFEPFAYLNRAVVIPTQPRSAFLTLRGQL
jgi:iron complex outermembrane receptor protein